jgi:hypothetical protein
MSFEEILLNVIDEEFSLLSESCQKIIYFYLKNEYNIDRMEIPAKIEGFSEAIESMFKDGAKILQIRIMKSFHKRIGYTNQNICDKERLDFVEYLKTAKASLHRNIRNEIPTFPFLLH